MGMLAGGGSRISTTPSPRTAFGTVPGPINVPSSVFSQLASNIPGFSASTSGTGNVINSQLAGTVSPATMNALKTAAAQFGVASGMPGSGLETNQLFGNIAGFSEGQQQKGVQNYLSEVGALGRTMTDPGLAAEISARNADLAAAPDPRLAHQQQLDDYMQALSRSYALSNPSRGPWWAPGGINTPPIGATVGRSYSGGLPGGSPSVFGSPDAFGYNYNPAEAGTTAVLGAINPSEPTPPGQAYQNWSNLSRTWSTSAPNLSNFYPGANPGEGDYVPDYPGQ